MNLEITMFSIPFGLILSNVLVHPTGLLSFLPTLISKFCRSVIGFIYTDLGTWFEKFLHKIIFCPVCVSGWCVIFYSIFTRDIEVFFTHTFLVMYITWLLNSLHNKFL